MTKDLKYYMSLPYTVVLRRDDEGDVVARVSELPGCVTHGSSEEEALRNLREVQQLWIEDCLEAGQRVPAPHAEEAMPSGKWLQRVPRSLHKKLIDAAALENVSLNQYVATVLAEAVGAASTHKFDPVPRSWLGSGLPNLGEQIFALYWSRTRKFPSWDPPVGVRATESYFADYAKELVGGLPNYFTLPLERKEHGAIRKEEKHRTAID